MNSAKAIRTSIFASFPFLALAASALHGQVAERVVFAPAEGTSLTKTFVTSVEMTMDDMEMLMNGEESPMMGDIEMLMTSEQVMTVTDKYVKMAEGQPAVLHRTYDELMMELEIDMSMEMMGNIQEQSPSGGGTSPLEGKTVVFELGDEGYSTSFAEGEDGDDDQLSGLSEDLDLRALLPESGSAEVGGSWDIQLSTLADVFAPGGDPGWEVEIDGEGISAPGMSPDMMSQMRQFFGDLVEGTAQGELTEIREGEDGKIAVIAISMEIETAADIVEMMEAQMEDEAGLPPGMEIAIDRADVEFMADGEGVLLWNLSTNHAVSFSCETETRMIQDIGMAMEMSGQSIEMEMASEMSGTMKLEVEVE